MAFEPESSGSGESWMVIRSMLVKGQADCQNYLIDLKGSDFKCRSTPCRYSGSAFISATPRPRMPSFCIRDCRVVRFRPSRAAAPCGPPTTQPVSSSARRMCSRSASSRVRAPARSGAAAQLRQRHLERGPARQDHRTLDAGSRARARCPARASASARPSLRAGLVSMGRSSAARTAGRNSAPAAGMSSRRSRRAAGGWETR